MKHNIFIAHAISREPDQRYCDIKNVLEIIMTLFNTDGILAFAPYITTYMYEDLSPGSPNTIQSIHELNKSWLKGGFVQEMWIYGEAIDTEILQLMSVAHEQNITIKAQTEKIQRILEKMTLEDDI